MKKSAKPKQRGVGRTLRIYEYEGKKYSLSELARMAKMKPAAMLYRLNHWASIELCVKKSVKKNVRGGRSPKYSFKGHKYTLKRLSELGGINPSTIASRIRLGWSVEDACTKTVDTFHNGHKAKSRQRPPGKRRFSGRSYRNSEQRLNELREKYKNGVTEEIMQEFAENLQIPRDFTKEN